MWLDVKIRSVECDHDAPGEVWLKRKGFVSVTKTHVYNRLGLQYDSLGSDELGFPLVIPETLPRHFVMAVSCPDGVEPHYWIYRFPPWHRDSALLFKLTHGGF